MLGFDLGPDGVDGILRESAAERANALRNLLGESDATTTLVQQLDMRLRGGCSISTATATLLGSSPAPVPTPTVPAALPRAPPVAPSLAAASVAAAVDVTPLPHAQCGCVATTHKLYLNCLSCGRILCEAEANVLCPHCGAGLTRPGGLPVATHEARAARARACVSTSPSATVAAVTASLPVVVNPRRRAPLEETTVSCTAAPPPPPAAPVAVLPPTLAAAVAHKDKLLGFDRSSAARTRVYDDDIEYFSTSHASMAAHARAAAESSWTSPQERAAALARADAADAAAREEARGVRIGLSFDFTGRGALVQLHDEVADARAAVAARVHAAVTQRSKGGTAAAAAGEVPDAWSGASTGSASRGAEDAQLRTFENTTLHGRAADVYAHLMAAFSTAPAVTAAAAPAVSVPVIAGSDARPRRGR